MAIYLDYAATSPLRPEVKQLVHSLMERGLGNPSSLHRQGRAARMVLEQAREDCAAALGAQVEEIVFT
ncbi:MAG: aminotransferase class V-fold PLP-dependent enzyme, partial [Candidatus Eremiobacteraeota bacterium]|nr:aminotransferase class V-fold PLP-dependent enzyme [Candidatus Eremiobacteraeota bacterium]